MAEPASMQEYVEKFHRNSKVSGFFLDTTQHFPCPFCAEPDWLVTRVLDVEITIARGATCAHCERSAKALVTRDRASVSFEFVQTGGPDAPAWLLPPMRRVEA